MNEMVMKLDEWGRPAWIALMVVSFILFWPVGLAVLAFLLWSGRMGCGSNGRRRWSRMADKMERQANAWGNEFRGFGGGSSGNRAFDEYREATLKRLEEEQREFRTFLDNLRHAKDRAEFDQFMAQRRATPPGPTGNGETGGTPQTA
jgi:hypothetical protein